MKRGQGSSSASYYINSPKKDNGRTTILCEGLLEKIPKKTAMRAVMGSSWQKRYFILLQKEKEENDAQENADGRKKREWRLEYYDSLDIAKLAHEAAQKGEPLGHVTFKWFDLNNLVRVKKTYVDVKKGNGKVELSLMFSKGANENEKGDNQYLREDEMYKLRTVSSRSQGEASHEEWYTAFKEIAKQNSGHRVSDSDFFVNAGKLDFSTPTKSNGEENKVEAGAPFLNDLTISKVVVEHKGKYYQIVSNSGFATMENSLLPCNTDNVNEYYDFCSEEKEKEKEKEMDNKNSDSFQVCSLAAQPASISQLTSLIFMISERKGRKRVLTNVRIPSKDFLKNNVNALYQSHGMSEYNVKASLKTGEKFVVSLKWNAQDFNEWYNGRPLTKGESFNSCIVDDSQFNQGLRILFGMLLTGTLLYFEDDFSIFDSALAKDNLKNPQLLYLTAGLTMLSLLSHVAGLFFSARRKQSRRKRGKSRSHSTSSASSGQVNNDLQLHIALRDEGHVPDTALSNDYSSMSELKTPSKLLSPQTASSGGFNQDMLNSNGTTQWANLSDGPIAGGKAYISAEEEILIPQLLDRVKDVPYPAPWDAPGKKGKISEDEKKQYVAKFLRARKNDLDLAEIMLKDCMKFRHDYKMDTMLQRTPRLLVEKEGKPYRIFPCVSLSHSHQAYSSLFLSFLLASGYLVNDFIARLPIKFQEDANGVPIMFVRFGRTHFRELVKYTSEDECEMALCYVLEYVKETGFEYYRRSGVTPQFNFVVDLDGFGWHCLPQWRFVRKINIVGSGDYEEALLQWFPVQVIPQYVGGSWSIDGDPECSQMICPGGAFPASYKIYED
eukprot:g2374.t1